MEFIVKTKPAEVLTANAGGVTTQADELERFLPKADGFMIYIYKGKIIDNVLIIFINVLP